MLKNKLEACHSDRRAKDVTHGVLYMLIHADRKDRSHAKQNKPICVFRAWDDSAESKKKEAVACDGPGIPG